MDRAAYRAVGRTGKAESARRLVWRDRRRAVGVHDRQDSGMGGCTAVGSGNGRPVGMKADLNT
jgi:hypothetical protein